MKLESMDYKEYGNDYNVTVLEQWKTCVEMANSNTEKRNTSNNLFITINSALFTFITFSFSYKSIFLSIVGIVICILWIHSINSYKKLSSVKYHIINEIERKLPLAPFAYEWEILKKEEKYIGLTVIEKVLPWLFIVLYLGSIILPVGNEILKLICPCLGGGA